MIIVWGSKLYGKTDEVPNLFHVATKFGHLYYVPLIPMGSHLIFETNADGWRGVPIPFSWKSFLLAWTRAATTIGGFGLVLCALVVGLDLGFKSEDIPTYVMTAVTIVAWYFLMFSSICRRASYDRAKTLAENAGLDGPFPVLIDLHFDMISQNEADDKLAEFEEAEDAPEELGQYESFDT
jgi:hypothetical protein